MSIDSDTGPRNEPDDGPSLRERVTKAVDEFSRVAVPFWLFALILTSTYVLLITWPITNASTTVVCSTVRPATDESQTDDGQSGPRRNWFEDGVIYLVSYCPPASSTGTKQTDNADNSDGGASGPSDNKTRAQDEVAADPQTQGNEDSNDPFSDWTVPRQQNALFLAVLAAGIIGGSVYSLRVHTRHIGTGEYHPRWWQWNASRPFLSGALAILFFFLIRAGFVEDGKLTALKPEGFIAIAGLVGLFTDEAWAKIRHVSEAVFAPANPRRSEDDPSGRG